MDPFFELERMAQNATATSNLAPPSSAQLIQWQRLFNYTSAEAAALISTQRADITRDRISDLHWSLVTDAEEASGYDREAYEHRLQLRDLLQSQSLQSGDKFIFRLGGLLSSAEKVMEVAGLKGKPPVLKGETAVGEAEFCCVEVEARKRTEEWLGMQHAGMK